MRPLLIFIEDARAHLESITTEAPVRVFSSWETGIKIARNLIILTNVPTAIQIITSQMATAVKTKSSLNHISRNVFRSISTETA